MLHQIKRNPRNAGVTKTGSPGKNKMNTFLNLQDEFILPAGWNLSIRIRAKKELALILSKIKAKDLNKRINLRGADEQYKSRFLKNYIGGKRRARNCNNSLELFI